MMPRHLRLLAYWILGTLAVVIAAALTIIMVIREAFRDMIRQ